MENTNDKSFVSHNHDKPFIRTMEDDLKKIKDGSAGNDDKLSVVSSLFVASSKENALSKEKKQPASVFAFNSTPAPFVPPVPPVPSKVEGSEIKKTPMPISAIAVAKKLSVNELVVKKTEQNKIEKDEKDRVNTEQEKLVQLEAEKELKKIKQEEYFRIEIEKANQLRKEKEAIEQAKKEKEKAEKDRIAAEQEKLAQIEAEKELKKIKNRDEKIRIEKEKAEQVRKEKEAIEQEKKVEAMKIRKKISEEIKEEMGEEIEKEKEKADNVKTEMALEIKKEIEAAEAVKKERELAMKKRVAKAIKEEMDVEIEKEKVKAEQVKKEIELEIKKEIEEDIEKEKELEKEIKKEMTIDLRKEIIEQANRKDIKRRNDKSIDNQLSKEIKDEIKVKTKNDFTVLKTDNSLKVVRSAFVPVNIPINLPISRLSVSDNQKLNKIQIDEKNKKAEQFSRERDLEIIRKKDEKIRKEKEKIVSIVIPIDPIFKTVASASKPIEPVSINMLFGKSQNTKRPVEETENLSPEARLARQASFGIGSSAIEHKEISAVSPSVGTSSIFGGQFSKISKSSDSTLPASFSNENKRKSIEEAVEEKKLNFFSGKFIKLLFIVLVIAGIGIGVYYFYIRSYPSDDPEVSPIPVNSVSFVAGVTEAVIKTDLNANLNSEIKRYFSDNMPSGMYRLTIKDKEGQNSLELENFDKSLNIILPNSVVSVLDKNYNLMVFNYPEKSYLRLGLVFKSKSSFDIFAPVRSWETDMQRNLEPIFMGVFGIYDPEKQFNDDRYDNFNIRYLRLGVVDVALNYAIDDDKKFLLITTSKQDMFNLIDKIIKGN